MFADIQTYLKYFDAGVFREANLIKALEYHEARNSCFMQHNRARHVVGMGPIHIRPANDPI